MLYTWNKYNIVNQLCLNKKKKKIKSHPQTSNDSGKEWVFWEGPSHSRLFYHRDFDLVCDIYDFAVGKNSQELLSNQWGLSTFSVEVPWNQCHSAALNILISFQHSNYTDNFSPQSTSPRNCWIFTSFFVVWNGLFFSGGKYLKFCFIILITVFWYG